MYEETSIQTKFKDNHEYKKLALDELVDVIEQYETKRDVLNTQNNIRNEKSIVDKSKSISNFNKSSKN